MLKRNDKPSSNRVSLLICAFLFVLITIPTFFDIYRSNAFHDTPIDDYFSYLRLMVRDGGSYPSAPFIYRPLAVAVAVPFYYILPLYRFTLLPDMDLKQLRAIEAVSMSWYVGMLLTSWLTYLNATRRLRVRPVSALLLACVAYGVMGHCGGIDSLVFATILLILYYTEKPLIYCLLMILSVGIDEKIPMIFFALWIGRLAEVIYRRDGQVKAVLKWVFPPLISLMIYAGVRTIVHASGNEQQTEPAHWIENIRNTVRATFSTKGIVLNGAPIIIMVALFCFAWLATRHQIRAKWAFGRFPWDVSCLAAMAFAAGIADVQYNAGRIVMHAFPIYLPQIGLLLDARFGVAVTSRNAIGQSDPIFALK